MHTHTHIEGLGRENKVGGSTDVVLRDCLHLPNEIHVQFSLSPHVCVPFHSSASCLHVNVCITNDV